MYSVFTMTRPLQYFKMYGTIVALSLPLGCLNDSPSPTAERVERRLETLQSQSQQLEAQAFAIESQIDEIRRANPEAQADEIKKLRMQFNALKKTHALLQQEMSGLRQDLTVERERPEN